MSRAWASLAHDVTNQFRVTFKFRALSGMVENWAFSGYRLMNCGPNIEPEPTYRLGPRPVPGLLSTALDVERRLSSSLDVSSLDVQSLVYPAS